MSKNCINCGAEIHPKRLEILPNTKVCVNCSNTGMKRGVSVLKGDINKDDTWNDLIMMEEEDYNKYVELQRQSSKFDEY
jgi:hypothetical protein